MPIVPDRVLQQEPLESLPHLAYQSAGFLEYRHGLDNRRPQGTFTHDLASISGLYMGGLTTHVLDTAQGKPARGVNIQLFEITDQRVLLQTAVTNGDGRTDAPLLGTENYAHGTYELVFNVVEYFKTSTVNLAEPPFLDEITIRFTLSSDSHYHVPLLVSPWSYSTYRGS